jgi:hypothetical protein
LRTVNDNSTSKSELGESALVFAFILLTALFAHFILFSRFGIYEDDYLLTLPAMKWSSPEWTTQLWNALVYPVDARPINHFVRRFLFFLTTKNGNIQTGYLVSLLWLSGNGFLLFRILRTELGSTAGFVGAIFYLLYPADTCRQILMHQTDLHLGATILFCSLLLYQANKPILSFCVAALSLLSYESFYLPFLAAPWIVRSVNRHRLRSLILHATIFFILAGIVFFCRDLSGEQRAGQVLSDAKQIPVRIVTACILGPLIGLRESLTRPLDALVHGEPLGYLLGLLITCGCFFFLRSQSRSDIQSQPSSGSDAEVQKLSLILLGGIFVWSFSYFLSFRDDYYPPITTIGRLSAVHTVGEIGAAICFAVCFRVVARVLRRHGLPVLLILLSFYFGLLTTFSVHIQSSEFVAEREKQKEFWQTIIEQIPDLAEDDVVLLEAPSDRTVTPVTQGFPIFGEINYYPFALPYFIDHPKNWRRSPTIFGLWRECQFDDMPSGRKLHSPIWAPSLWPVIQDGHIIYFRVDNNRLVRIDEPVDILGRIFKTKVKNPVAKTKIGRSKLFQNIFGDADSAKWFTIRDAPNYPR